MCNAVSDDFDGEPLSVTDRLIASLPTTHHARKLKSTGDPATVFFPIQINRQIHAFIILCGVPSMLHPGGLDAGLRCELAQVVDEI